MSNSYNYLPIPPRAWSRFQNPCTYIIPDNSYNSIYIPLTNQTVSLAQALIEDKIQYKGNILQYKGNSSRLTKKQKYSKISNRLWCNRTTVFATQTQTYSNPNTTGFARINSVNIPFPNQIVGSPNNISGPYQYGIPNPNNCNTTSIEDGGSLLCGSYANPCTGEITQNVYEQQCYPTSCSDVPGQIIDLCWNPKMQTYFPRNRSTMSTSGNKFPQGYKGFVSAVTPVAPVLLTATSNLNTVTLNWSYTNNFCIPISTFQIYQNDVLIQTVSYTINSATINNLNYNTTYSFYIVALSTNISSAPSNILTVLTGPNPIPPTPPNFINGYFTSPVVSINSSTGLFMVTTNSNNPLVNNTSLTSWLSNCQCGGDGGFTSSYVLYIFNGNFSLDVTLNPPLPAGVTQYIGFFGSSDGATASLSISQTINFTTIGLFTLSFYVAPSNPSSTTANYNPNNNNININVSDNVLNQQITINPSNWSWVQETFQITIPATGNYTFTFTQNITGNYSPDTTASVFFLTGFNLT